MRIILFTVEEANRFVPELRPRIERLVEAKREFDRVQAEIDVLALAAAGASSANPDAQELRRLHEQRNRLGDQISHGVSAIHRRGCLVKDLDRGLIDFYALAGDRLVFLCWQHGEAEVAHWHTLDGGFKARQRIHEAELD